MIWSDLARACFSSCCVQVLLLCFPLSHTCKQPGAVTFSALISHLQLHLLPDHFTDGISQVYCEESSAKCPSAGCPLPGTNFSSDFYGPEALSMSCSWPDAFRLAYAVLVFLTRRVIETKSSLKYISSFRVNSITLHTFLCQMSLLAASSVFSTCCVLRLVAQSCLTLWDPHGWYPIRLLYPGERSSILQARILEWIAMPFSRAGIKPRSPALQVDSLSSEPPGKPGLAWPLSHKAQGNPELGRFWV